MEAVFLKILNMSITAGWLVLAVLVMRFLLKKAPKFLSVIMWALVGIRLVLPFSLESALSLIPSAETVPPEILYEQSPEIHTGISAFNSAINPVISESFSPTPGASVNPLQVITILAGWIWVIGMAAMVIYSLISCLRIRRKLREATPMEGNVYLCDRVDTPFIFGLLRPRIYLPSSTYAADIPYILAHEQAHLKRKDHLWKPLGFLLLTVYWFNPLLWLAYILLCRDIEAACDEKVLKDMGEESKKPYSSALVNCSVPRKMVAACPLAFGEVNVKSRIKKVLNYKKPAFWLLIAAVIACIVLSVCFLTNPRTANEKMQVFLDCQIAEHHQSEKSEGNACCLDYEILGTKRRGKTTTVYMWVLYEEYSYADGQLKQETGFHTPTVITARKEDGNYRLVEYFTPRDGAYNPGDIKAKFPWYLWGKAMDSQRYIKKQQAACLELAEQYFAENPPADSSSSSLDIIYTQYPILDYARGLIDSVEYDIDNDGTKEHCELYYGPTSGLFTFMLAAFENGQLEYCNVFLSDYGVLSFQKQSDGTVGVLLIPDANEDELLLELYNISLSDGNILLTLGDTNLQLEYWGPQGIDAAVYDDIGLCMQLQWEDNNVLNAVFEYQPYENAAADEVTTTSEYKLYIIHNEKRWPFEDYVRKILGIDYPAIEDPVQKVTYVITPDKPVAVPVYLDDLAIELPAGTYEIIKEVNVRIKDEIHVREYIAEFAIVTEDHTGLLQQDYPEYFNLPTDKGLKVVAWQMGPSYGWYSWGLLPGKGAAHTWEDYLELQPVSLEDVRAIVESYELSPSQISVELIRMPYSSYFNPMFAQSQKTVESLFWGNLTVEISYCGNRMNTQIIDDPQICSYLSDLVFLAESSGQQSSSSKGYSGALYSIEIHWDSRYAPYHFTVWDQQTFSVSTKADSEGYAYFYKADMSELYAFLTENYPDELWYPEVHPDSLHQQYDIAVYYAGGDMERLDPIAAEAENALEIASSSQLHLPVVKFDTQQELEDFCWKYVNVATTSGWDEVPSFQSVAAKYDEAFFENNTLLLVYVSCGNCTHRFDVNHVFAGRGAVSIRVNETTGAEVVDDAIACWFITVTIPKSTAEQCTGFDAILGK